MLFSSGVFLIYFLPFLLLLYTVVPVAFKNAVLLLASLFFYAWGEPVFVFVLLGITVADFYITARMDSETGRRRKQWLIFFLILHIGLLVIFKYPNFLVHNFNLLLEALGFSAIPWQPASLPIGISFFTFQAITYAVDIYRKEAELQRKIQDYALFVFLFPHLIAGPIVKYNRIAVELTDRVSNAITFHSGMYRFCIGLAKKVLLANVLAEFANILHSSQSTIGSGTAWLEMLAYTFQIYFDFSGYSDMAIGLGAIFGFHFPENFDRPYGARSITEFWQRWHITLGDFMRNYLYIPLGGNRRGSARTYFNLLLVFFLSGLWHGDSWNFVLWGLFHGIFLVIERLFLKKVLDRSGVVAVGYTFLLVLNAWVFFRFESFAEALAQFRAMWSFTGSFPEIAALSYYLGILAISIGIALVGILQRGQRRFSFPSFSGTSVLPYLGRFVVMLILYVVSFSYIIAGSYNPFIYFRF
jgi:alginate O-acetyltransferase complex protein AlgI